MEDFTKKDVFVKGHGTISVMEWLRDNNCPHCEYTSFYDEDNRFLLMVSDYEFTWADIKNGLDDFTKWHQPFPGLYRMCTPIEGAWLLAVNGHVYFANM